MARTVALWRCKCGTRPKVVAEAGSSPSAEQIVLCPKCRAPHAVHADKIISLTEETFERQPLHVTKRYNCWLLWIRHSTHTNVWRWNLQRPPGRWLTRISSSLRIE